MLPDEYDTAGTSKMLVKVLMETLGLARDEIASFFQCVTHSAIYVPLFIFKQNARSSHSVKGNKRCSSVGN